MSGGARRTGAAAWLPWMAMAVVVVVALAVGTLDRSSPTDEERANALEETIRCPQCKSQSVAGSNTPSAEAVKVVIRDRIGSGDSDEEIRDFVASRYGRDVLLTPSSRGFDALVWAIPVVVAVAMVAGLAARFREWRPGAGRRATAADRNLVAQALAHGPANDGGDDRP